MLNRKGKLVFGIIALVASAVSSFISSTPLDTGGYSFSNWFSCMAWVLFFLGWGLVIWGIVESNKSSNEDY